MQSPSFLLLPMIPSIPPNSEVIGKASLYCWSHHTKDVGVLSAVGQFDFHSSIGMARTHRATKSQKAKRLKNGSRLSGNISS